jgi:FMN phosphatase YigB (HAD superfamily)/glycosyltransferase involved in cell wall biosynthesis
MRVAIVHYHLSLGGVARVIETAADALQAAAIPHVILTGAPASHPAHRQVPGLGYLPSPGGLTAEILAGALRTAATDALGAPPDLWHFHNHSLGKNRLFAEVVALLAEAGERLVLQIHDLAENGRPQNYPLISNCAKIYPFSPRIHYAFLNTRDRAIFTAAGLPEENSSVLTNPVPCPAAPGRNEFRGPSILFAPVRGIRRKNLGELVLLAALAPADCHFAVSRAPLDPDALAIHDTWHKLVRERRLPIEFNVVDRFAPAAGASADFDCWIAHATHFVTTSVEEGFGLPFLEAVAHRKPLIGRDLPHVTAEHARHGIRSGRLYQKILVPVDWVEPTILESHLTTTLVRNHRLYQRPLAQTHIAAVLENLIHHEQLDFGNLPEPLQQGVIERLAEKSNRHVPLVRIAGETRPLEDWLAEVIASRNPTADPGQLAPYSIEIYQTNLTAIYQRISRQPAAPVRYLAAPDILTSHLTPAAFHFLLSAPEPKTAPVKFRAFIFDIYGTLLIAPSGGVKPDPFADPVLREIIRQAGHQPPPSPSTELHEAVTRHHASAGVPHPEIDLRVLWREILRMEQDEEISPLIVELEAAWHPARPMPGAAKIIQRLARSGVSLGLLSNAQCNTLPSLGGLADLFAPELTLLSYQHRIAKPSPELFDILTNRLAGRNITPAETLYIGNDPLHDILPAAAAGFRTALFTGHPDSLRPGVCRPDFVFTDWKELQALV